MSAQQITEKHYQWLVLAVHRKTRAVMVWAGPAGFVRITDRIPAQLVGADRVDELVREAELTASDLVFELVKLPVRDILQRRKQ